MWPVFQSHNLDQEAAPDHPIEAEKKEVAQETREVDSLESVWVGTRGLSGEKGPPQKGQLSRNSRDSKKQRAPERKEDPTTFEKFYQQTTKGASRKWPCQKASKIVKKCQGKLRHFSAIFAQGKKRQKSSKCQSNTQHFSTIFAQHLFSGPVCALILKILKIHSVKRPLFYNILLLLPNPESQSLDGCS